MVRTRFGAALAWAAVLLLETGLLIPGASAQTPSPSATPTASVSPASSPSPSPSASATPTPTPTPVASPTPTPTPTPTPSPTPPTPTPTFKARTEDEIRADIEKDFGKTPAWVAVPIFDQNADPWPPILLTLAEGYNSCFGKLYPESINEFGHNAAETGTQIKGTRRFDRPETQLVACIEEYYRTKDVAGADGRPIRVAFDSGTAVTLTQQAQKERDDLIKAIAEAEKQQEQGGGPGAPGGSTPPGTPPPGGSGPGGSGPGGTGPGGTGPGGTGPGGTTPQPPGGSDGPLPPTTDAPDPEDVPELPGGEQGPVVITDLDTKDPPRAKDQLHFDTVGHEIRILGSGIDVDPDLMVVRIAGSTGATVEMRASDGNLQVITVGGDAVGVLANIPDELAGGKDLRVTLVNESDEVNGTPGPVVSPAKKITVTPTVDHIHSDPTTGLFPAGGDGTLVPGQEFEIWGQGFPIEIEQIGIKVNGQEVAPTFLQADPDGGLDLVTADAPATVGGAVGSQVQIQLTVRKGTPEELTIDAAVTLSDPDTPPSDPIIQEIQNAAGSQVLTALDFNGSTGDIAVRLRGFRFAAQAADMRLFWNGVQLTSGAQYTSNGDPTQPSDPATPQEWSVTFHGANNVDPILRAGNTKIRIEYTDGTGAIRKTPDFDTVVNVKLAAFTSATQANGAVEEAQEFYLEGYGFGNGPGDVVVNITGYPNVAITNYNKPGSRHRLTLMMGNDASLAAGDTRTNVRGSIVIGGKTWSMGNSTLSPQPDIFNITGVAGSWIVIHGAD